MVGGNHASVHWTQFHAIFFAMARATSHVDVPKPGSWIQEDFRNGNIGRAAKERDVRGKTRAVQWNVERGYQLLGVVEELRKIDADVICLQEIDIGCERSQWKDTGREIAQALEMNYCYVTEFEEIHSKKRSPAQQGGGVHGNAILTRYDIEEVHVIHHKFHPVNWERDGEKLHAEPRRGERVQIAARIKAPFVEFMAYSVHLEVFCGMLARLKQFADVVEHVKLSIERGCGNILIGADLNTLAHGIARFSPRYCCDRMRFRNLGSTESEWFQSNYLEVKESKPSRKENEKLASFGFSESECLVLTNPDLSDPFDCVKDFTICNHWGLMKAKVDWLMTRSFLVKKAEMGNLDFAYSDHRWLMAEGEFQ